MQLVRFVLLSYQPPVPPPKVVPLPTSEVGAGHTAPSDAAFVPYHGALPTLEVRACGDCGRGGARGTAGGGSPPAPGGGRRRGGGGGAGAAGPGLVPRPVCSPPGVGGQRGCGAG